MEPFCFCCSIPTPLHNHILFSLLLSHSHLPPFHMYSVHISAVSLMLFSFSLCTVVYSYSLICSFPNAFFTFVFCFLVLSCSVSLSLLICLLISSAPYPPLSFSLILSLFPYVCPSRLILFSSSLHVQGRPIKDQGGRTGQSRRRVVIEMRSFCEVQRF